MVAFLRAVSSSARNLGWIGRAFSSEKKKRSFRGEDWMLKKMQEREGERERSSVEKVRTGAGL